MPTIGYLHKNILALKRMRPSKKEQGEKVVKSKVAAKNGCDGRLMTEILTITIQEKLTNSPEMSLLKFCHQPTITTIFWPPPLISQPFPLALFWMATPQDVFVQILVLFANPQASLLPSSSQYIYILVLFFML